ncbi:MAG: septal ring lytic transglycosylase RlpA family protein [Sphingomonadaceae bacterium]|nr:septal ring lytic transglycosylase RlpA family protein [Sphingomonadaceae bacterium]
MTALGLLAACAGHSPPPRAVGASRPAPQHGAAAHPAPHAARPGDPTARVKVGQPYFVMGHWYTPADDPAYDETGIASWYGPGFHALSTASGEIYDQDGISAAHKTLPLPSFVEVTNLDNGRVLTVRVNDRGPFVDGRIIDLSRKSAQLLGVDGPGTAHVRVRRVYPDAQTIALLTPPPAPPPPPPTAEPPPVPVVAPPVLAGDVFIQVAAVSDQGRAEWLKGYLTTFGPALTVKAPSGLWRVRIGPFAGADAANPVLARVQAAGYTEARTVVAVPGR